MRFDDAAALNLRVPADSPNARPAHLSSRGDEDTIQTPDYRGVPVLAAYRYIPGNYSGSRRIAKSGGCWGTIPPIWALPGLDLAIQAKRLSSYHPGHWLGLRRKAGPGRGLRAGH